MKKKSYVARLGVLALALTLVTTCLTGGTMARYVTEVTGDASANVAAWIFKANSSTGSSFNSIDMGATANRDTYTKTTVKEGVIAPGTKGSFKIEIDGTGSDVGVDYTVKIAKADSGNTLPSDLKFTTDNTNTGTQLEYTLGQDLSGTINYDSAANAMKKTITVNWEWPFDESDTKSSNDNTFADKDWSLDITVTGKQVTPATPSA